MYKPQKTILLKDQTSFQAYVVFDSAIRMNSKQLL